MELTSLDQQAHGSNVSRLLGELDIDSAQCLIEVDVISLIQSDKKYMSFESGEYVFEDGSNNVRQVVKINLERFIKQMREVASQVPNEKRQRSTSNKNVLD